MISTFYIVLHTILPRLLIYARMQVANYGIGGRYTPHFDFGTVNLNSNERRGDRIATFMTYVTKAYYLCRN